GVEPDGTGSTDEPEALGPGLADDPLRDRPDGGDPARAVVSPMSDLPGGAAFGTLVHTVLETVDTTAPLGPELLARCVEAGADRGPGIGARRLAQSLEAELTSPLGPGAPGLTLAGIAPRDRLAELEFELPLAGGDLPGPGPGGPGPGRASVPGSPVGRIGALLAEHLPDDDPFRPYAEQLVAASFSATRLRGYLTGSLDAVLRLRDADGTPRYVVVDYKTNRLAAPGGAVTAWHYR